MFGGGGAGTPPTVATTVEEYDGTNWSQPKGLKYVRRKKKYSCTNRKRST
jgi:hypothetical protein